MREGGAPFVVGASALTANKFCSRHPFISPTGATLCLHGAPGGDGISVCATHPLRYVDRGLGLVTSFLAGVAPTSLSRLAPPWPR